jgi:hypothetical protein
MEKKYTIEKFGNPFFYLATTQQKSHTCGSSQSQQNSVWASSRTYPDEKKN